MLPGDLLLACTATPRVLADADASECLFAAESSLLDAPYSAVLLEPIKLNVKNRNSKASMLSCSSSCQMSYSGSGQKMNDQYDGLKITFYTLSVTCDIQKAAIASEQ